MDKVYSRINWVNREDAQITPLGATNLNKIDYAVDEIDERVIVLDTTKALESEVLPMLANVEYNEEAGIFTFTRKNGTQIIADLNIEKIPVSFEMDENGLITMITDDGSEFTADVGALIKDYTFHDSDTIDFKTTVDASGNKKISADIIDGSITDAKMQTEYLADCQSAKRGATNAATSANEKAILSQSWAEGGTGTRAGEETNNAKYWCEQARIGSVVNNGLLTIKQNGVEMGTFSANAADDVEIDLTGGGSQIDVDDALSLTSENPVQNKVLTGEIYKKKSVYNATEDNVQSVIDNANVGDWVQINRPIYAFEKVDNELDVESENPIQNKAVAEEFENIENYSTEEVPIGKWIDGKTIYRRCINTTTGVTLTTAWVSLASIPNSNFLINCHICRTDSLIFNDINFRIVSGRLEAMDRTSTGIAVGSVIVAEYTKTTD